VINQLTSLRLEANKSENYNNLVSKLLLNEKIVALDVGAQGGFNENIFPKKYNDFFSPIMVEPIKDEADKLKKENYKVISKGLWSNNCVKKLYIMKKRLGSSSLYKPNKDAYALYDLKKKNYPSFEVSNEIDIECTTIKESLNNLNIKKLDFLKIDTQGAEIEILKGLGNYLPLLLKIEVQIVPMYENIPDWSELINHLYKLNYMTCEWEEIGNHATHSPVEMDMLFIPNYLNHAGKELIMSRKNKFISLMLIFGQIKLLQIISTKLNFSETPEIEKLKDKFFY
jgi:FkbM family methyltransferase